MSVLDDDAFAGFNEAFVTEAAPDEGPPAETPTPEPDAPSDEATATEPEPEPEQPSLLAGKYKSPEELEHAYIELQRTLGSQKNELGELRQALEERIDGLARQQNQPFYDPDVISQNPGAVAQQIAVNAIQNGMEPEQNPAYNQALEDWFDQAPREATNFMLTLERVRFQQQLEERTAPLAQTVQQQQDTAVLQEFGRQHPDIGEYATQIEQIAATKPTLSNLLRSPDPQARVEALETLYLLAKAQTPSRATSEALTDHARQTAEDAARAVQEAAVVTTGNTNQGDPPQKDYVDQMFDTWQTLGVSHLK